MQLIQGKTAFITGGASGIGLGIAGAFVEAGMKVVLADLRQDHIDEAMAAFRKRGQLASVHAIRLDVTDRAAMAAAANETERVLGKLHVLVNNAGVGIQGPFKGITYEDWDFGLAVNLGGVINGIQTFLPKIRAHGEGGHIVNTASLAALVPMPAQYVIYQTAKAAVVTLSEAIRGELAQEGIVSPSYVPALLEPTSTSSPRTGPHASASATPSAQTKARAVPRYGFPACWRWSKWALWSWRPFETTNSTSSHTGNGGLRPQHVTRQSSRRCQKRRTRRSSPCFKDANKLSRSTPMKIFSGRVVFRASLNAVGRISTAYQARQWHA